VSYHPFSHKQAEPTRTQDFRLKPEHASPLPLKRRGVRRAKALFCQDTVARVVEKWTAPLPTLEKVLNATATEDRTPVEAEPATV
jgi:hypothetical protein